MAVDTSPTGRNRRTLGASVVPPISQRRRAFPGSRVGEINALLTGPPDLPGMRTVLLTSWLRMATLGLAAFAMALVLRPSGLMRPDAARPEPRFAPPPAGSFLNAEADAEGHLLAALERKVTALSDDLSGLRSTLEAMAPLPDQDEFFIPIEMASIERREPIATGVSPLVDLYLSDLAQAESQARLIGWAPTSSPGAWAETGPFHA